MEIKEKFKKLDKVKHILTREVMLILEPYLEETGSPCKCHSDLAFQGKYLLRRKNYETIVLSEEELSLT